MINQIVYHRCEDSQKERLNVLCHRNNFGEMPYRAHCMPTKSDLLAGHALSVGGPFVICVLAFCHLCVGLIYLWACCYGLVLTDPGIRPASQSPGAKASPIGPASPRHALSLHIHVNI